MVEFSKSFTPKFYASQMHDWFKYGILDIFTTWNFGRAILRKKLRYFTVIDDSTKFCKVRARLVKKHPGPHLDRENENHHFVIATFFLFRESCAAPFYVRIRPKKNEKKGISLEIRDWKLFLEIFSKSTRVHLMRAIIFKKKRKKYVWKWNVALNFLSPRDH